MIDNKQDKYEKYIVNLKPVSSKERKKPGTSERTQFRASLLDCLMSLERDWRQRRKLRFC